RHAVFYRCADADRFRQCAFFAADDRAGYGNGDCRPGARRSFCWLRRRRGRGRGRNPPQGRFLRAGAARAGGGISMAPRQDKPPKDYLRIEDRILWETVAKTATPLAGKKSVEPEDWLDLKQSPQKPEKPTMPGTVQAPNNAPEPK